MKIKDEKFYKTIKEFLETYLMRQKNYSKNTQKSYRETLFLLLKYFKEKSGLPYEHVGFENINYDSVCGFVNWLETTRNCSPATINHRLSAIKSFTKYCAVCDPAKIALQISIKNVPYKKQPDKNVGFISEKAVETLISQANINTPKGLRDRTFMLLMYDSAARCQEILDLRLRDIELKRFEPLIYLHRKSGKEQSVPISDDVATLLKSYMRVYHPESERHSDNNLFYTVIHGQRHKMSPDTVALFFEKYSKSGHNVCDEVPEKVNPHLFRHSRAMHLYRKGMPLVLLSEFLGHADPITTKVYAWADTEMKRQALANSELPEALRAETEPVWEDEETILRLYGVK